MEARRSLLVLGGARSGKSSYAEERCIREPGKNLYLATAEAHDDEMRARISQHQARRGNDWQLREEPLDVVSVLETNAVVGQAILVDCLTLWISNLMMAQSDVAGEVARLADVLPTLAGTTVTIEYQVCPDGVTAPNVLCDTAILHIDVPIVAEDDLSSGSIGVEDTHTTNTNDDYPAGSVFTLTGGVLGVALLLERLWVAYRYVIEELMR